MPADPTQIGAYGRVGNYLTWRQVHAAYEADDLGLAMKLIESIGLEESMAALQLFRMIDAELISRNHADLFDASDLLTIEADRGFPEVVPDYLAIRWDECVGRVMARLQLKEMPPVLLTVLVPDANASWVPGRHGYCVAKRDFYKICIPSYLLGDEPELDIAVSHEATHALIQYHSGRNLPRWLDEGIAMRMGGHVEANYRHRMASSESSWPSPEELDRHYSVDRESDDGARIIRDAYQQSLAIVDYMCSLQPESKLGKLVQAHRPSGILTALKMSVTPRSATEDALENLYGLSVSELFHKAKP
ncbi:MAG: hypothetical protein JST40_07795 [Armatimonadetes bacterium]|nr:hypothetical protein [Armatimonadota bacterium]